MATWNANKPFGFLNVVAPPAIKAAGEYIGSLERANVLRESTGLDSPEADMSAVTTEPTLIRQFLTVLKSPDLFASLPDEQLLRAIFGIPSELVRGLALLSIITAAETRRLRFLVEEKIATLLSFRFGITDPGSARTMATHWLDALTDIAHLSESNPGGQSQQPPNIQNVGDVDESVLNLDSQDPLKVRRAIHDLVERASLPVDFVEKCREKLQCCNDAQLRMLLIRQLVRLSKEPDRLEISKDFAGIVLDETLSLELRDVAYQALHEINKLPVDTWPELRRAYGRFEFPQDVDWELVSRFTIKP